MIRYDEKDEEHFAIAVGALCDSGTRASASSDSKIHYAQRWRSIGNMEQEDIMKGLIISAVLVAYFAHRSIWKWK